VPPGYDACMRTIGGIVAAVLLLAACGGTSSTASVTACKHAMRAEFAAAASTGAKGTEPAECKGLPAKTLQRLAEEILGSQFG